MDFLARGAAPPGVIDMVHSNESHLRRRFAMIARYDGKAGRWSAAGIVLSLLVGGVALTGAVKGQDAAPAQASAPAQPAAAREVKAAPSPAQPPSSSSQAPATAEPERREEAVLDEDVDRAVLAQLDRKLPEVNFDGVGLSDVVDFLRDVSGANMVVEWGHLAAAGIEKNAPVTLRVKNVKFGRVLDLLLSSAGGGSVPLGYTIEEDIIRVSTREHLDSLTDVRAYDVHDIVPTELQIGDLTKMITETVAPETWREGGGSVGTMHATKHKLIVRQTPMNHRQVRAILRMLREDPTRVPQATDAASAAQGPAPTPARAAQPAR
jgi:hypothetical protein